MRIKVINKSGNPLPDYETDLSAGMDLRADISAPFTLKPLERKLVSTGLFIELPAGYEAQIRPRSGLAYKFGITVLNTPGTIDADYRGEIKVLLVNLSSEEYTVQPADRIAQMVIATHAKIEWEESAELNDTLRGAGGLGHTGLN